MARWFLVLAFQRKREELQAGRKEMRPKGARRRWREADLRPRGYRYSWRSTSKSCGRTYTIRPVPVWRISNGFCSKAFNTTPGEISKPYCTISPRKLTCAIVVLRELTSCAPIWTDSGRKPSHTFSPAARFDVVAAWKKPNSVSREIAVADTVRTRAGYQLVSPMKSATNRLAGDR